MNTNSTHNVLVIGGGLGGLAAACTLAARGRSVVLLERSEWIGGKAAVLQHDGFRFDMGPTILTLPGVLRRIFGEACRDLDDALDLVPLDPQWRSFFHDGSVLDLFADLPQMQAKLRDFTGNDRAAQGYKKFLALAKTLDDITERFFFWRPIGGIGDMMDKKQIFTISLLRDVLKMRMGHTVAGTVRRMMPDARVAQMLDHFTQYVGSAPDQSPAVLCAIAQMQTEQGVWYPRGGTAAVPRALASLAIDLGVEIRTQAKVKRIVTKNNRVCGVELESGETIAADAVVSNSDVVRTHRELLSGEPQKNFFKRRKYEPACSGVVLYLGLRKKYDHLLHHNFVFSRDPHEEFDYIYRRGEPAPDPTAYVCAPAITEPEVAPPGGEALYVLVHTPYLRPGHDWSQMLPRYRRVILDKLATTGQMPDLDDRIVFESTLTPEDIDRRYHVLNGAIYGLASHGRFLGAFKPSNRSPDVQGLYLAGGSAHPGPGMPMALMSGWIAADTLDRECGKVKRREKALV